MGHGQHLNLRMDMVLGYGMVCSNSNEMIATKSCKWHGICAVVGGTILILNLQWEIVNKMDP